MPPALVLFGLPDDRDNEATYSKGGWFRPPQALLPRYPPSNHRSSPSPPWAIFTHPAAPRSRVPPRPNAPRNPRNPPPDPAPAQTPNQPRRLFGATAKPKAFIEGGGVTCPVP